MSHASKLENYAESVAAGVLGPMPADATGARALPWAQIITMVMQLVEQMLTNCPMKQSRLYDAFRKPTRRHRSSFGALVYNSCQCCSPTNTCRMYSGAIAEEMEKIGVALPEADVQAIMFEVSNPDWEAI